MKYFKSILVVAILSQSYLVSADSEGMKQMPKITPKKIYTVKSKANGEDILDSRGFGDKEPEVRMMNLMMVEGSGVEGMDMSAGHSHTMQVAANENATKGPETGSSKYEYKATIKSGVAKVGANVVNISIRDLKANEPKKGLKPKAQVYMTSMDMGTDEPRVRETSPGNYQLTATFSMKGPWAVKLMLPDEEKV